MKIARIIFSVVIGVIFGIGSGLALIPATAAFNSGADTTSSTVLTFVVIAIGALLGLFAPTIRRAFGRGFLLLGTAIFALPLSVLLLSGRVASDMVASSDNQAATAIGAGIAGTLMTGASAFIGFFLGAIFIVIGLVLALGGRREVIIARQ